MMSCRISSSSAKTEKLCYATPVKNQPLRFEPSSLAAPVHSIGTLTASTPHWPCPPSSRLGDVQPTSMMCWETCHLWRQRIASAELKAVKSLRRLSAAASGTTATSNLIGPTTPRNLISRAGVTPTRLAKHTGCRPRELFLTSSSSKYHVAPHSGSCLVSDHLLGYGIVVLDMARVMTNCGGCRMHLRPHP